jgi:hypothetical protein
MLFQSGYSFTRARADEAIECGVVMEAKRPFLLQCDAAGSKIVLEMNNCLVEEKPWPIA